MADFAGHEICLSPSVWIVSLRQGYIPLNKSLRLVITIPQCSLTRN